MATAPIHPRFFPRWHAVRSIRSQSAGKKEKETRAWRGKSDGPAGIFTDHLADGIFGSSIPSIFDNNGRKLGKEKKTTLVRANTRRTRRSSSHRHAITRAVRACLCALAADAVHDSPTCYLKSSIERMDREDQVICEPAPVTAHRIVVPLANIFLLRDSGIFLREIYLI